MNIILETYKKEGKVNHAYLIAGDFERSRETAYEVAREILSPTNGELSSHPDFFYQKFEVLGIDDSRELKEKTSTRPFFSDKKIFIIETLSFTTESSNALLKTFEDPTGDTIFFLLAPSIDSVIPTLRSRFFVIDYAKENYMAEIPDKEKLEQFLSALPSKRLKMIKEMEKDKQDIIDFVNRLEFVAREKTLKTPEKLENVLSEIEQGRKMLFGPVPFAKMVLEQLAFNLPQL